MRRLTPFTLVWRNFLYANQNGYANDPEEFLLRVQMIQDQRDAILEQMLKPEPDLFLVEVAKEEITFQLDNLEDIIQEFSRYAEGYHFYEAYESMEILQKEVYEDLQSAGTESELYIIAEEWQKYAINAKRIIQEMPGDSGFNMEQQDYLMEQMMELQMNPDGRNNLLSMKETLKQLQENQKAENQSIEVLEEQGVVMQR